MTAVLRGEPTVVERTAQPYVGVRKQVTMDSVAEVADRIPVLVGWLAERGHAVAGAPLLRYHVIDTAGTLDIEAGVPVVAAVGGDGDVESAELPAGRYVSYRHVGHPRELVAVTGALLDWAKAEGLRFDVTGTAGGDRWGCRIEEYHTHPAEVPDMDHWETEVALRLAEGA